jgi:hypothetical protein
MENGNAIRRTARRAAPAIGLLALTACATPPPPFSDLPRLNVTTQITSRNMCGLGVSPAIDIGDSPAGTERYRIRMTNMSVLWQDPWETTATAAPGGFREGALADYEGPCIGERRLYALTPYFSYRFEVLALDARDRPLAYGRTSLLVRSISETIEQERAAASRSTPLPPASPPESAIDPVVNPALNPRFPGSIYEP